jgi:hypothetical protein
MEKISSSAQLKEAILVLEIEQTIQAQQLKEQFQHTYESLKPINILKNTLMEVTTSPLLLDNILGGIMGLASGYFSKKIVVGSSHNIFRKFMGVLMQFGVSNVVAQNPETLKNIGKFLLHQIFHKKENNTTTK